MIKILHLLIFLPILIASFGCKQAKKRPDLLNYDIKNPVIFLMPSALDEISGIAFVNGSPDSIYAIQDEDGKIFHFYPGDKAISHTRFSKKGDYEDVAICRGFIIILRSDGTLFSFPKSEINSKQTEQVKETKNILPKGEYESLYVDDATKSIYALCKDCNKSKKDQHIAGHILELNKDGNFLPKSNFFIDLQNIHDLSTDERAHFKPSAMAKNNKTKEWYIISSVHKLLLITNESWLPIHVYPLNPVLFTQPEGIAFDNDNNLYIANEMGNGKNGTLLKFLYNYH
jgi:hypothetical protein